ncbi:hypothetical protein Tco_0782101 [Tanacetum coccineum]
MHKDIMAAGSKDRPPMLAPRRYAQWQSRFLRYVDMKSNKEELKQCIFNSPYVMTEVTILAKPVTATEQVLPEHNVPETYGNTTAKKCESLNKQDVKTNLFWKFGKFTSRYGESIESYYSRFYKMMNEMIRNKLEIATMQGDIQFQQQLQPEWSRFVTVVKETSDLDTISYHKLFAQIS